MLEEVKVLIEAQGKAFEEFKSANDKRMAQIESKGSADAVTVEQVKKLNGELDELQKKLDDANKETKKQLGEIEKLAARPSLAGKAGEDPQAAKEMKSFIDALRSAKTGSEQFEYKDQTVGSDGDGGYYVPTTFNTRIVERVFETTPMRGLATVMTTGGDDIEFLNNTTDIVGNWVGEQDARPKTTGTKPGKIRIPANEMYAMPQVSQKLLDDAFFNLEAYLTQKIADKFARMENAAFVNGSGVGQPNGIINYSANAVTTADATRAWGKLQYLGTGNSGAFASSNPGDIIFDLVYALKTAFLPGASWLIGRDVLAKIRELKNSVGGYLWQPNYAAGQPPTLADYPVTIAPDMPALAANSFSVAFGNFKEGYTILDRMGMRLLRDPYTSKPDVAFYATKRTGGDVTNFEAIKLIKFG